MKKLAIIFISISLVTAPALAAAPNCSMLATLRDQVGNAVAAFQNVNDSVFGGAESCGTDASGAIAFQCKEVQAADQKAFQSHYNYKYDDRVNVQTNLNRGFYACNNAIEAKRLLHNLAISDLAAVTHQSLQCNLPLLNEVKNSPNSPAAKKLLETAYLAYQKNKNDLVKLAKERLSINSAQSRYDDCVSTSQANMNAGPESTCTYDVPRDAKDRLAKLNAKISLLTRQIPLTNDKSIQAVVEQIATRGGDISFVDFATQYRAPIASLATNLNPLNAELEAAHKAGGGSHYVTGPSLERRLMGMGGYNTLINAKQSLSPILKNTLTCESNSMKVGNSRFNTSMIAVGALSAVVTGGASLAGMSLAGGARVGLVALDLGLGAASGVQTLDAIYNSCYKDTSAMPTGGKCTPDQALNMIVSKTTSAECAWNVATGAAPGVLAAAGRVAKLARAEGRLAGAAEEAAASAAPSAGSRGAVASVPVRAAAAPAKVAAVAEQVQADIVVTARARDFARHRPPCISSFAPVQKSIWGFLIPSANAGPCTVTPEMQSWWKMADEFESEGMSALADARAGGPEMMANIRAAKEKFKDSAETYSSLARKGEDPRLYKYTMENYIRAGRAGDAARERLQSVARLGENPATIIAEMKANIAKTKAALAKQSDIVGGEQLRVMENTLQKFEEGLPKALADRKAKGLADPTLRIAGDNPEMRVGTPGAKPGANAGARAADEVPVPAPTQSVAETATAPAPAPTTASVANVPAPQPLAPIVSAAQNAARGPHPKLNEFVLDLEQKVRARPIAREGAKPADLARVEDERKKLLAAVQEIRRQDAVGSLYTPQENTLRRLEQSLIRSSENPATQVSRGNISEAVSIYRTRLADGWPKAVVEREINQRILNASMMRDAILRNPRTPDKNAAFWSEAVAREERVLRELRNPPAP